MLNNTPVATSLATAPALKLLHGNKRNGNILQMKASVPPAGETAGNDNKSNISSNLNSAAWRPLHVDPHVQYYLYYFTYPATLSCQRRYNSNTIGNNNINKNNHLLQQTVFPPDAAGKLQEDNSHYCFNNHPPFNQHHKLQALLYEKLQLAHNRSKLSNELMTHYHLQVSEKDYRNLLTGPVPRPYDLDPNFDSFDYLPRELAKERIPEACLAVINDLDLIERWRLKRPTLARFFCLVVRGYRDVPYHNVRHAFSVYHFAYLLSKRLRLSDYLDDLAVFAFLISAVCHDLDHRGTTNAFQVASQSVLAALYSSEGSVMERHHLAQSMCIINTEGCNIFESLSSREYQQMLDYMRDMILATDLAHHLNILPEIRQMISDGYRRSNERHRYLLTCMLMTASDLSDQTKPWRCSVEIAQLVYKEFFSQGDLEKAMGRLPCEMMDRDKACIPQLQIQFIGDIVAPVFEQVERLFGRPKTGQLRKSVQRNVDQWQQVEERYVARRCRANQKPLETDSSEADMADMSTSLDIFDDQDLFSFELLHADQQQQQHATSTRNPTDSNNSDTNLVDRRRNRRRQQQQQQQQQHRIDVNNDYQQQFAAGNDIASRADGRRSVSPAPTAAAASAFSVDGTSLFPNHHGNNIKISSPNNNNNFTHYQSHAALHSSNAPQQQQTDGKFSSAAFNSNKRRSSSSHTAVRGVFCSSSDAGSNNNNNNSSTNNGRITEHNQDCLQFNSRRQHQTGENALTNNNRSRIKLHEVLFYTHPQGQKPSPPASPGAVVKSSLPVHASSTTASFPGRAPLASAEASSLADIMPSRSHNNNTESSLIFSRNLASKNLSDTRYRPPSSRTTADVNPALVNINDNSDSAAPCTVIIKGVSESQRALSGGRVRKLDDPLAFSSSSSSSAVSSVSDQSMSPAPLGIVVVDSKFVVTAVSNNNISNSSRLTGTKSPSKALKTMKRDEDERNSTTTTMAATASRKQHR